MVPEAEVDEHDFGFFSHSPCINRWRDTSLMSRPLNYWGSAWVQDYVGAWYREYVHTHTWCRVTQLSGNASPQNSHGIMASSVGVYQICLHILMDQHHCKSDTLVTYPYMQQCACNLPWILWLHTFFCIKTCMLPQVVYYLESNADSKTPLCLMMLKLR